jgi:multiple sugar transport system permease protein
LYNPKYAAWVLSGPGLLLMAIFVILPFFIAIYFSFTNRMLVQPAHIAAKFVGLRNYIRVFDDPVFLKSFLNNLYFAIVAVPIQLVISLLLALLVNNRIKGISIFRFIFFSPAVIPLIVIAVAWSLLLTPGASGLLNNILSTLTFGYFQPLDWLFDTDTALNGIIIMSIWMSVGFQMMILLAALQSVSQELLEAAYLDGANAFQRFRHVILPELRNSIIFLVLTSTIGSFKVFGQVFIMTKGGPQNSTSTIVYMIYEKGFINQQLGYSSAIAVVVFLIIGILAYLQQRLMKLTD